MSAWFLFCLCVLQSTSLRAGQGLDASSPVAFFTSAADSLLKAQPEFARFGLSVTNIPIYPTNCYTPAVHRLLQLAANLYDASTNKTTAAPDDFDYPSVFRPTFGVVTNYGVTSIFINGYVEVTTNADYNAIPLFLPDQAGLVTTNTTNIYDIPWVIGARRGFPNFNQFSYQSVSSLARKVQIVKDPANPANHSLYHTNIQYGLSISNTVAVEAWNSNVTNYTRPVTIFGVDAMNLCLTNDAGQVLTNITYVLAFSTNVNGWPGFPVNPNNQSVVAQSFQIPLSTNVPFLPGAVLHPNGVLTFATNFQSVPFDTTTGYPQPLIGLNMTNHLRFIMVDTASGRAIDYVHFGSMNGQRNLLSELHGNDDFGPGGVWDTNRVDGTTNNNSPIWGVVNQVQASLQNPPYTSPGYPTQVTLAVWQSAGLPAGFSSVAQAVQSFNAFYFNTGNNPALTMQVPFTPTRSVSVYYTWQANDPLVHYTTSDLTGLGDFSTAPATNYDRSITDQVTANLSKVNNRYLPWAGTGARNPRPSAANYEYNAALMDPQITRSDDWIFPTGPLNFATLGEVHRGTPWQTVYLKSAPVDPVLWQNWTGNANSTDAAISQPVNDWRLATLLAWLLNPTDPRQLISVNSNDLSSALNIVFVVTNSVPSPIVMVMGSNSPQAAIIVNGINSLRAGMPGGLFAGAGDILGVPELSLNSPWLDLTDQDAVDELTDADYEMIPSQLLPLLRQDSLGSTTWANGAPQFQFTGFDDFAYRVDVSSNLTSWTSLGSQFTTNGILTVSDPAAGLGPRYYRTSLIPHP